MPWYQFKRIVANIGFIALCIVGIYLFVQDWRDRARGPHIGDRCGPHHHWIVVGTPFNDDISCEEDGIAPRREVQP